MMRYPLLILLAAIPFAVHAGNATLKLPAIDAEALRADADLNWKPGAALQVSQATHPQQAGVSDGLADVGGWSANKDDGRLRWTLNIDAPGALSVELLLTDVRLPDTAGVSVVAADGSRLGPWSASEFSADGVMLTPLVFGDQATLELRVSAEQRHQVSLQLAAVNSGFRDPRLAAHMKAGACNVDTVCPEGEQWRDLIQSVVHYRFQTTGGTSVCTGQLLGNTSGSQRPLVLTANHCLSTQQAASSMTFYWNYESPQCRSPGSFASGQALSNSLASHTQSGATLLATWASSDFTLVELNQAVPSGAGAFWSGWDRRDIEFNAGGLAIHHPQGHEKRISFADTPLRISAYGGSPGTGSTHLRVQRWALGTTEPGSSGSGLWTYDGHLVGQLHGGGAACGNNEPDWYGRLNRSWTGGGTAQSRLREHLDPGGSGTSVLNGYGLCAAPVVSLSNASSPPRAGAELVFNAAVSGGQAPYHLAWDLDDNGEVDAEGQGLLQVRTRYPGSFQGSIRVRVTDAADCATSASLPLTVTGPNLQLMSADPVEASCGSAGLHPGGHYRQRVRLRNDGIAAEQLLAMFAPASGDNGGGDADDQFGHGITDGGASCGYQFIDISDGTPLALTASSQFPAEDDGATAPIALNVPMPFYDSTVSALVMSTNGYLSTNPSANGGDWQNRCSSNVLAPLQDSTGGRINVLHDDLLIESGGGLYHRWFAQCPRAGSGIGCHVFQWDRMGRFSETGGIASFQAVIYPVSGELVYQYRDIPVSGGAQATVSIQNPQHDDRAQFSCNQAGRLRAAQAICFQRPAATTASSSPLQIINPLHSLGALAPGAQREVELQFTVDADASCGDDLGIDFLGSVDNAFASGRAAAGNAVRSAVLRVQVAGNCQIQSACPAPGNAMIPDEGNFFDPGREGNGLEGHVIRAAGIEPVYYGAWFTGDAQRQPTWYIIQGAWKNGQVHAPILQFTWGGNWVTPPQGQQVGEASLAFLDNTKAVFRWQLDDRQGIEALRYLFEGVPSATSDRTGGWFNPEQGGWGLTVNSYASGAQNRNLVIAYLYDDAGFPRWLLSDQPQNQSGAVLARRVHCPGCPWLPVDPSNDRPAGTMRTQLTSPSQGLFDASITLPAPLSGSWQRQSLPLLLLTPPERP